MLNSEKSNSAPCSNISVPRSANCSAVNFPVLPSGIVYNTLLLVWANVSSKSNTLIFLTGALGSRATFKALSIIWASVIIIPLLVFFESLTPLLEFNEEELSVLTFWGTLEYFVLLFPIISPLGFTNCIIFNTSS